MGKVTRAPMIPTEARVLRAAMKAYRARLRANEFGGTAAWLSSDEADIEEDRACAALERAKGRKR